MVVFLLPPALSPQAWQDPVTIHLHLPPTGPPVSDASTLSTALVLDNVHSGGTVGVKGDSGSYFWHVGLPEPWTDALRPVMLPCARVVVYEWEPEPEPEPPGLRAPGSGPTVPIASPGQKLQLELDMDAFIKAAIRDVDLDSLDGETLQQLIAYTKQNLQKPSAQD